MNCTIRRDRTITAHCNMKCTFVCELWNWKVVCCESVMRSIISLVVIFIFFFYHMYYVKLSSNSIWTIVVLRLPSHFTEAGMGPVFFPNHRQYQTACHINRIRFDWAEKSAKVPPSRAFDCLADSIFGSPNAESQSFPFQCGEWDRFDPCMKHIYPQLWTN